MGIRKKESNLVNVLGNLMNEEGNLQHSEGELDQGLSANNLLCVGLDPGGSSGFCMIEGPLRGVGFDVLSVAQWSIDELIEYTGVVGGDNWWSHMGWAGVGLAVRVHDACSDWLFARRGGSGFVHVVMEDFLLTPGTIGSRAGMGGRDPVIPVALGSAFWTTFQSMVDGNGWCTMDTSVPSNKSMFNDAWLKEHINWQQWGRGKPHGVDAMRHALIGMRQFRNSYFE